MTTTEKGFFAYVLCTLSIVCGIVAMGIDNTHRLARCEATGQHRETCRLLVLGR